MITVSDLGLAYSGQPLFSHVDLQFTKGNCYGIIGANGAGKSTFLKILSGELEPTSGEVSILPKTRMSVLKQDQFQYDEYPVIDTVIMGNPRLYEVMKEKDALYEKPDFNDEDGARAAELEGEFAEMNGWDAESDSGRILQGLGIAPELYGTPMGELKGGDKVKVLLAQALFGQPDILLLDEPTNNLDIKSIDWLEDFLLDFPGTLIVVSHDRYFMDKVVDHLLVFRGNADIKDFPGNYTQYREWKEVQDQLEKETEAARQARMAPTVEKTSRLEKVQKKKLTFKERKEFEALEVEIPLLEAEKAELETAMSSGTLSNDELLAKSERIAKVIEEIDEKTMRWLELSELA